MKINMTTVSPDLKVINLSLIIIKLFWLVELSVNLKLNQSHELDKHFITNVNEYIN